MRKEIAVSIMILTLVGFNYGQGRQVAPTSVISKEVTAQVVRRILRFYFKPGSQPREVWIADTAIRRSWLPQIRNVRFVVIPSARVESYESVYEFVESEMKAKKGFVWFGKFYPTAGGSGDIWQFDAAGVRLRVWRTGDQWRSGGLDHGPEPSH